MKRKYALFFVIFHFAFFILEATAFSANLDVSCSPSTAYASEPKATGTDEIDQLSSGDATNRFGTVAGRRIGKRFPAPPGRCRDILYFEKGLRPRTVGADPAREPIAHSVNRIPSCRPISVPQPPAG